jgi:hypothetical protein
MRDANEQIDRESIVLRICWMLFFTLVWYVAEVILALVIVMQLICRIFQGRTNPDLLRFGDCLSQYLAQIGQFGSFNTEDKPWPFADWPLPSPAGTQDAELPAASKVQPEP